MKTQKRIWELQHTTVCKVCGLLFDLKELKNICVKARVQPPRGREHEDFTYHSTVVSMCERETALAKRIEKSIEDRFTRYARRLDSCSHETMSQLVFSDAETPEIPLWAVLWHLATRYASGSDDLEGAMFARIHMLEHQLLKESWQSPRSVAEARQAHLEEELLQLRREVMRLRTENKDLESRNRQLKVQQAGWLSSAKGGPDAVISRTVSPGLTQRGSCAKVRRLESLLQEAAQARKTLESDLEKQQMQIAALTQELLRKEGAESSRAASTERCGCNCPLKLCLQGKRITMVGGLDSLEPHYRALVESCDGNFCRHDGRCAQGSRSLDESVRCADLVVCPVSVNSHFAATRVKSTCKKHGVTCQFTDSAGLSALRAALQSHFGQAG